MKPILMALALLAGGCVQQPRAPAVEALQEDSARIERIGLQVDRLSTEQQRVMLRYARAANAHRPHIADDLLSSLTDHRYGAYRAQLDMVHEFAVVQDRLASDRLFNGRPDVIALQSEMQGTTVALTDARQEYNFAAAIYLDRLKRLKPEDRPAHLIAPSKITWFSDHNGSESARSATVFDDDGD